MCLRAAILIQLTFICFTLKQKIAVDVDAATSLQMWWRAHQPSKHFAFGRSVRVIQELDRRRAIGAKLALSENKTEGLRSDLLARCGV
jgi:hypothetical protein